MFAKSSWFGPSKDGVIELDMLMGDPPLQTRAFAMVLFDLSFDLNTLLKLLVANFSLIDFFNFNVWIQRGPNITSELDLLDTISGVNIANLPLLAPLLDPKPRVTSNSVCQAFRQGDVVESVGCIL
jgi:hypothetical protein